MTDEIRTTKLDYDGIMREKTRIQTKINELEAQVETLSLRDNKNKKLVLELNEAQLQLKAKDAEIDKQDSQMRKVYLQKEDFEVEAIQLRKTLHELQITKNECASQKEILSGQTKDNERRIFDLMREKQDCEKKVRENAIVIRDLAEERDKFKRIVAEKDEEIADLSLQVKNWRSSNTDLKLIEEKVEVFVSDLMHVLKEFRHSAKPQLQDFLRVVRNSEKLSKKITMRQRETGHEHLDKMDELDSRPKDLGAAMEGDQTHQSHVWQSMISVKE